MSWLHLNLLVFDLDWAAVVPVFDETGQKELFLGWREAFLAYKLDTGRFFLNSLPNNGHILVYHHYYLRSILK